MNNLAILSCLSILLLCSCHKSDPIQSEEPENTFKILPSSSNFLKPYFGKDRVVFEDSLGNELVLKIRSDFNSTKTQIWKFHDVYTVGDTVYREYPCTGDIISLKDDSDQFLFVLELFPQLYIPSTDSNAMKAVDHIHIYLSQPFFPKMYSVFSKVIHPRDSEDPYHYWSFNITEASRTFLGTTFSMVEHTDYTNPKALAYYNHTYGIVAFTDYRQKLWRLKL